MKVFDLDMIKGVYSRMPEHIDTARKLLDRPLTLTEKKFSTATFRRLCLPNLMNGGANLTWILIQTG